jgi:hypothetical protein
MYHAALATNAAIAATTTAKELIPSIPEPFFF